MRIDINNPPHKYSLIYADPPWNYRNSPTVRGAGRGFAKSFYDLMGVDELGALPVSGLAEKNAVLFMWATFPAIQEALATIKNWGFNYRTCAFVWVKKNKKANTNFWGCGYYTRSNAEICLLATKGKILERKTHSLHQIIEAPVRVHSQKPDEVRAKIVELFGDLSRVELFARQSAEGWDCWGDQAPGEIE